MGHYRREIRKILLEMGYTNKFDVQEGDSGAFKAVTIKDWEPDANAYLLKRRLERDINEKIEVCFTGPHITGRFCI